MMQPQKRNLASSIGPALGEPIPSSIAFDSDQIAGHIHAVRAWVIEVPAQDRVTTAQISRVGGRSSVTLGLEERAPELHNPTATLPTRGNSIGLAYACLPLLMDAQGPETMLRAFLIGAAAATAMLILLALYTAIRTALRPRIAAFRARHLKRQEARQRRRRWGKEPPPESQ
ncbi:MAG: hypothetical protein PVJ07_03620 [Anaerolineales bacterium]|jgi:hypothetical protein